MGRRWANRLQLALLSLLAGIAGLSAWVAAVCPPATVCLTPPPGCVSSMIWSGPACSTDSPYCCQYYVRKYAYSGPTCGSSSTCVSKSFLSSFLGHTCVSGTCVQGSSSGGSGSRSS